MGRSEMPERTREILDRTADALEDTDLSRPSRMVARAVLKTLKQRRDYSEVINQIQQLEREVTGIAEILGQCSQDLRSAETDEATLLPGGEAWWNQRSRDLVALFDSGGDAAVDMWVERWTDALQLGQHARCHSLIELGLGRPGTEVLHQDLATITRAMEYDVPAAALDAIDRVVDGGKGGVSVTTRLGVLRTRILLSEYSDRDVVRTASERIVALAEGTTWAAVARTGLAEDQLVNDGTEVALATLRQAAAEAPPQTDTLLLMGEAMEADARWAEADQLYDDALKADPRATERVLLRQVPPRLLVRAASRENLRNGEAIDLLFRALDLGVPGDGDYPERDVQVQLAQRLRTRAAEEELRGDEPAASESRDQAAAQLLAAGQRFSSSGFHTRSVELLEEACELAPQVADYRWQLAEALRLDGYRSDGTPDRTRLERARDELVRGLDLRMPKKQEAWVYCTWSKIHEDLGDHSLDPALLLERALLLDPGYGVGYTFLASALRRQGYVQEALEASRQADGRADDQDAFVFRTRLLLLFDSGRYDEARILVEQRSYTSPDDPAMRTSMADLLLRVREPEEALDQLEGVPDNDSVRIARGLAAFAAHDPDRSRDEFRALWLDTSSGPIDVAGYAAFRAGLVDRAIELYTDLAERAPGDLPFARDLGQMHLVRGDVARGRELLERGVDRCPYPDELDVLARFELDYVRDAVAGQPHALDVAEVVADVTRRIGARVTELRQRRRDLAGDAARAGHARQALFDGRPMEALRDYRGLLRSDQLPEAGKGAVRAARAARDLADVACVTDSHDQARQQWRDVEAVLADVPGVGAKVRRSLVARRLLADLVDRKETSATAWFDELGELEPITKQMRRATAVLAHSPAQLWALRDGLIRVRDDPATTPARRDWLDRLGARIPVDRAYRLAPTDAATFSSFLSVGPLELHLGRGVAQVLDRDLLARAVGGLQADLELETGVRIPWVHPDDDLDLEPSTVDFLVYGRRVGSLRLDGDPDSWLGTTVGRLDEVVRGHLFRMVGVDDVNLWLEGWDLSHRDAPDWHPRDPVADRLRLARLLRMLLREGVPVVDRHAIVRALDMAGGSSRSSRSATLDALRDVRVRLGRAALGVRPDASVAALPHELEERAAGALRNDGAAWELPRPEAERLVTDLRAWLHDLPDVPVAVEVRHPALRPYLWRLLAAEEPVIRVVSQEELS